ncbi:MAG TPA: hypothetical protein VF089_08745 [Candidatus Binatia bacterium]
MKPKVYYRLTNNWLERAVRFIVEDHGIRRVKDAMSRDILRALKEADIKVASTTFEITGLPPLRIRDAAQPLDKRMDNNRAGTKRAIARLQFGSIEIQNRNEAR